MTPLQQLRDESELEWFFSKGQIAFERSTFGGMLERAELYSVARLYRPETEPIHDNAGRVIGHEQIVTARPTAELRQASGYEPDLHTLQRYAHISALLRLVERQSRRAVQVLELLYGDLGQRWAPSEPFGRLGALFHITPKGRQLLDDARNAKGAIDLADVMRMEAICTVQRVQPKPERAQALAYCHAQAKALEQRARTAWLSVRAGAAD
jgi:hypothetical protein